MDLKPVLLFVSLTLNLSGCLLAAAGAGAEGGYVLTQESRTAGETLADQRITATIKTQMLADASVSGLNINVDTFKRGVLLEGVVDSASEAAKAIEIARMTDGVLRVESKLVIVH